MTKFYYICTMRFNIFKLFHFMTQVKTAILDLFRKPPLYYPRRFYYNSPDDNINTNFVFFTLGLFFTFLCALACISCAPAKTITNTHNSQHDSTNIQNQITQVFKHDSIFIRDSVYIKEITKNDTVYIQVDKIHIREKEKIKTVHDTLTHFVTVSDTITDVQIVTKEVPKRSKFLIVCTSLWWSVVLVLLTYITTKIYKRAHGL